MTKKNFIIYSWCVFKSFRAFMPHQQTCLHTHCSAVADEGEIRRDMNDGNEMKLSSRSRKQTSKKEEVVDKLWRIHINAIVSKRDSFVRQCRENSQAIKTMFFYRIDIVIVVIVIEAYLMLNYGNMIFIFNYHSLVWSFVALLVMRLPRKLRSILGSIGLPHTLIYLTQIQRRKMLTGEY